MRRCVVVAAAILVGLVTPRAASACDCYRGTPACQAYWTTPVVFLGHVSGVFPGKDAHTSRVRFVVTEAFKGIRTKQVELIVGNTDCDLWFKTGEDWLIYAYERSDSAGLSTSNCSRSRPLGAATEDLAYLRSLRTLKRDRGRIIGELEIVEQTLIRPAAGVLVEADDPLHRIASAMTDANGRFEIEAVPGTHKMTAKIPGGMTLESGVVTLVDARGCADWSASVGNSGSIAGVLLDARGAPLHDVMVAILPAAGFDQPRDDQRAITDAGGRFEVGGLMPGEYYVAVADGTRTADQRPRMFYAGGQKRFRVQHAQLTRIGVFQLPQRVSYIEGQVVRDDGRPVPGIKVALKTDVDGYEFRWITVTTDQFGRFIFGVLSGPSYRVAIIGEGNPGLPTLSRIIVDTSKPLEQIRLVLR